MPNDMKKKEFDVQKKGGAISPRPNKFGSGSPCPIQMRETKQKKECGTCRYYDKSICQKEGVETTPDSSKLRLGDPARKDGEESHSP